MEVLYNRLISARFRGEIANVLCDYRYQLEPDTLPLMIKIWERVNRSMYSNRVEVERARHRNSTWLLYELLWYL